MSDLEMMIVSDEKRAKLAKKLAEALGVSFDDATSILYEEWDLVEHLFLAHGKVKTVLSHLIIEINHSYRIA